jgi:hypothetical protein
MPSSLVFIHHGFPLWPEWPEQTEVQNDRNYRGVKTFRKRCTLRQKAMRVNFAVSILKGQCHEIFCFWFFSWISFPPAPEYPIRIVSNFFENSRRYSQVKVHHRYQRHRRQTLPPVSLVLLIPVANLPPVSTTPVTICRRCHWYRWQIVTGVVDTGGKFATGINDTGGK